jgi:hypothetical protein
MPEIIKISSEDEFADFLELHQNEILGLYHDTYYKNGGWNGMMDALDNVEKRYGVCYDVESIDNYDKLVNEYLF